MIRLIIILGLFLASPISVHAAKVVRVKGKKLLVQLEGDTANPGDLFYTIGPKGKRRGIIKILKIKGTKAIARLGKGRARKGWSLQFRPKKRRAAKKTRTQQPSSPAMTSRKSYIGIIAGAASQTMAVNVTDDSSNEYRVNLSGVGFQFKGMFDYELFQNVWFRGMFGYESLNVTGARLSDTEGCGDGFDEDCNVNIGYLSLDFWGRYVFNGGMWRFWLGAGFNLLFPISKDANAVQTNSITNTSTLAGAFGVDIFIKPDLYIPVQLEYGLYPSSADVAASYFGGRIGLGFAY